MRAALLALLAFAALACASPGEGARTEEADLAFRQREYERAYELYERAAARRPSDPLIREKKDLAFARAHGAKARNAAEARRVAEKALSLVTRGDGFLAAGEPERALSAYRAAMEYVPGLPEARRGEVRAEDLLAAGAREGAAAAEKEGGAGRALGILGRAISLLGADAGSRGLVDEERQLRERIAKGLTERARAASGAGRAATARLLELARGSVLPDGDPPDPAIEERARGNYAATLAVLPVEDGTGGRLDPEALRREIVARLGESPPGRWFLTTEEAAEADLAVRAGVESLAVNASAPRTERVRKVFALRTETLPNPEFVALARRRDRLEKDRDLADRLSWDVRREYEVLRDLGGDARIHGRWGRQYGEYTEAAYYRHLANARIRLRRTQEKRERLDEALSDARARLVRTPRTVERVVEGHAVVDVTTAAKTVTAAAWVRIDPGRDGVAFETVKSEKSVEETVSDQGWPADEGAGLSANPLELPGDAELAKRAVGELARVLVEEIRRRAIALRLDLARRARAAEGAGRVDEALELYAAFLFTGRAAFPLEARVALDKLEAHWGIRITKEGVDVSKLRLE